MKSKRMRPTNFILRIIFSMMAILASFSSMAYIKKEYQLAEDGFEWYKIQTDNGLYGAQDVNGNIIVPAKYYNIYYRCSFLDSEDGYFGVQEKNANGAEKDSNGLKIIYEGVYTKDGKCLIPTVRQFRRVSKDHVYIDNISKEYYSFIRGDKFNEYGICDANGKVLFMRNCDNYIGLCDYSVILINLCEYYYWVYPKTPEYGKDFREWKNPGFVYNFDFDHLPLGTSPSNSPASGVDSIDNIAKQKHLKHPLADAPAKATLTNTSTVHPQGNAPQSQTQHSSASSTVDLSQHLDDLIGHHWKGIINGHSFVFYFSRNYLNGELQNRFELLQEIEWDGTSFEIPRYGKWLFKSPNRITIIFSEHDIASPGEIGEFDIINFSETEFKVKDVTFHRID